MLHKVLAYMVMRSVLAFKGLGIVVYFSVLVLQNGPISLAIENKH